MTVRELIDKLEKMPKKASVVCESAPMGLLFEVTRVEVLDSGKVIVTHNVGY